MANPAKAAREAAESKGFSQVFSRLHNGVIMRNPGTGKCSLDLSIGTGWHYGAGLEADTAWEADADQNYLKMVKALYNVRARKAFQAGDLLKWIDPRHDSGCIGG